MTRIKLIFPGIVATLAIVFAFAVSAASQQPAPQQAASRFDVTNYRIEAQIIPDQHMLRAGADVTFVPLDATRSVVFELNGSLKVESIEKDGKALSGYVQDAVGVGALGPSVRIDLGEVVPANVPVTLRIRWSGALVSPEGGPLATKRLAYVGTEGSYLMYASRWFPFHDYAADRATSDITFIVPCGTASRRDQRRSRCCTASAKRRCSSLSLYPSTAGSDRKLRGRPVHQQESHVTGITSLQLYAMPGSEKRIDALCRVDGSCAGVLHEALRCAVFRKQTRHCADRR